MPVNHRRGVGREETSCATPPPAVEQTRGVGKREGGKPRGAFIDKKFAAELTPNNANTPIDIAIPYTIGMWEETKPAEIALVKGKNILLFTRNISNCGLTIKDSTLTPVNY